MAVASGLPKRSLRSTGRAARKAGSRRPGFALVHAYMDACDRLSLTHTDYVQRDQLLTTLLDLSAHRMSERAMVSMAVSMHRRGFLRAS